MAIAEFVGLCVGASLALHFRALILAPSAIVLAAFASAGELIAGRGIVEAALAGVAAVCTLQVGYLLGVIARSFAANRKEARVGATLRSR